MRSALWVLAASVLLTLAGCAHETKPVGGSVGAIAGSGPTGGAQGNLSVGATASGESRNFIDQQMSDQDRQRMLQVLEFNRANAASSWTNPSSNKAFTITPQESYNGAEGTCRDYSATVNVAGSLEQNAGTACRLPNGGWEVVK